jgi:DNA-binding transcriptional ArsR family regulator
VSLRYRQMGPEDVPRCVSVVAAHPVIGPRYGKAITDLSAAWLRLLDSEAKSTVVFEELQDARVRILGVGVSVFVNDDFMREVKTPPLFWIGPELARRIARGNSPLLTGRALRDANTRGGLNLLTWEGCIRPEDAKRAETYNRMILAFMEEHRGFLWKEIIGAQAHSAETVRSMLKSGGALFDPAKKSWVDSYERDLQEFIAKPHLIGLDRETALSRPGSWVGGLFDYEPPRCGFSHGEQRLLSSALGGETDEQLARALGISRSAIKKTWRSIYDRVARCLPELVQGESRLDTSMLERGKEKKHRLLGYLREHTEELRPVSRKLLQQDAARKFIRRQPAARV